MNGVLTVCGLIPIRVGAEIDQRRLRTLDRILPGDGLILHVGRVDPFRAGRLPEIIVGVVGDAAELELLPFGRPRRDFHQSGFDLRAGVGNDLAVPLHIVQAVAIHAAGKNIADRPARTREGGSEIGRAHV